MVGKDDTGAVPSRRKAAAEERAARLAEALRANLARRKGQNRARAAGAAEPEPDET